MANVLYVVGKGRSGSSILTHALGQFDGFVNTGELYQIWHRLGSSEYLCGCGELIAKCPLWGEVNARFPMEPREIAILQDRLFTWREAPRVLAGSLRSDVDRYVEARLEMYRLIGEIAQAAVIVDGSKWPADPLLFAGAELGLAAVHLVRDPRAVAYSWRRTKGLGDVRDGQPLMPRYTAGYSAASWLARSLLTGLARRRSIRTWTNLRYEDFSRYPARAVEALATHAGSPRRAEFIENQTGRFRPTHSVAGNSSRFVTDLVAFREDAEWCREMPSVDRWIVTSLTLPLLGRYGYSVWSPARPSKPLAA